MNITSSYFFEDKQTSLWTHLPTETAYAETGHSMTLDMILGHLFQQVVNDQPFTCPQCEQRVDAIEARVIDPYESLSPLPLSKVLAWASKHQHIPLLPIATTLCDPDRWDMTDYLATIDAVLSTKNLSILEALATQEWFDRETTCEGLIIKTVEANDYEILEKTLALWRPCGGFIVEQLKRAINLKHHAVASLLLAQGPFDASQVEELIQLVPVTKEDATFAVREAPAPNPLYSAMDEAFDDALDLLDSEKLQNILSSGRISRITLKEGLRYLDERDAESECPNQKRDIHTCKTIVRMAFNKSSSS